MDLFGPGRLTRTHAYTLYRDWTEEFSQSFPAASSISCPSPPSPPLAYTSPGRGLRFPVVVFAEARISRVATPP